MEENKKSSRLFSLDLLRGLDMMFLTVLVPILWSVNEVWGLPQGVIEQIIHPWEGISCLDIIMPLFIFMCGAAIPFALERRIEKAGGKPDAAFWKHVFGRVALLWGLGLLVQGRLLTLDMDHIRFYDNTLQAIAAGYLAVAVTICSKSWKVRIGVPVACFVIYGLLLHFLGDYSINGNFAAIVEQKFLYAIMPASSDTCAEIKQLGILANPALIPEWVFSQGTEIHYTWYLTTLMCAFMSFCGYFATKILQSDASEWQKARRLTIYGLAMLVIGLVLALLGVKVVKHIYTVSFTAIAMGICILLLAALYVLTDIWRFRKGMYLPILFGQFALVAYIADDLFRPVTQRCAEMLCGGIPHLLGTNHYQPVIISFVIVLEIILLLVIRRRLAARK